MNHSTRVRNIPPYLFARLEEKISEARRKGMDIINLGIGDPDLPPPAILTESVKRHIDEPDTHFYSTSRGNLRVREDITQWFKRRFKVAIDPETEIAVTIGSKEGLANFSRAYVNPGDYVGVPNPGYPVYGNAAVILNEGRLKDIPLRKENGFKPNISDFEGCKLVFVNYPNNPTGAMADYDFYTELAEWIEEHPETVVVHDAAYSEMTFDEKPYPSFLQYTRNTIEFHSLSKVFNATGYRIGFAVGKKEYIDGLVKVKSQLDSGAPLFIQRAMVDCLKGYNGDIPSIEVLENRRIYAERKSIIESGLNKLGYKVHPTPATFYIWFETGGDEMEWAEKALSAGVAVTPGRGFGSMGEGFARISATVPDERLKEALGRLTKIN
ncbi:aminotransferase class I/II-fold pyridoxal phosphate-dependent enzyme [bacterium]|nr:aminotransferase class I/II-fold pyridoxal phosphate-dependent enzyme [bacterium]